MVLVALALGTFVSWYTGVCFMLGTLMSGAAGWVGMKAATSANVRVSNTARVTKKLGAPREVAVKGGRVMGLAVGGFALLGLFIVYIVFGIILGQLNVESIQALHVNWIGVEFVPITMSLSGYALGCSLIALFQPHRRRGIYTKAADMGADLVGKTEAGIPEDDPRNPATIADNVGDNVGDVAAWARTCWRASWARRPPRCILAVHLFLAHTAVGGQWSDQLLEKMMLFPLVFVSLGLISPASWASRRS